MAEQMQITTLADFHTAWAERADVLVNERERQRADLATAEETIEALQRELAAALQRRDEVLAAQEQTRLAQQALPAERDAAERELIRSTLLAGIESVEAAQRRRGRISQMERDLAALLAGDPDLSRKLAAYQEFAAKQEQIAALPELYRQAVLEAHERLAGELAPYFELEQSIERLRAPQPATLWVVVTELPGEMAGWVLPIPVDGEQSLDEMRQDRLAMTLLRALGNVTTQAQSFDGAWDRFAARLAGQQGASIEERAARLQAALTADAGLSGFELQLRVLVCSPEAWARAWDGPASLNLGWYTLDDLRAWTRRVDAGSQWGQYQRRLRTMLVRMVGRGAIAPSLVPADELWAALPEPHRGALRDAVTRLCTAGVLHADPTGAVGLAPERLDEVEHVITRKFAPPWASGLGPALVG